MLTLTENAQSAIKAITAEADLPETGGVRIAVTEEGSQLHLELAPEPQSGDEVVEAEGARVFTSEEATQMLDGQELDAGQTEEGTGFTLRQQT
ncbi:HesB/IscA family protein [Pseudactinotalea sp. Z1739]|uniref:HesB/IscA family protein n=1 Tax=Pseudactinotalea sp. Z1739 TaxID=3413028 RepID=UPI003C7B88DE